MSKSPLISKTIVANSIALAVALYQYFVGPLVPVNPMVWAFAVPTVNLALRFVTKQPIAFR